MATTNRPLGQTSKTGSERRIHRRHTMETRNVAVKQIDRRGGNAVEFGQLMDISASGVRVRIPAANPVQAQRQIRLRIELPAFGMIAPFIDTSHRRVQPSNCWTGWVEVCRVHSVDEHHCDVAGRILDMRDMERGMLGLYLSTQPMAA